MSYRITQRSHSMVIAVQTRPEPGAGCTPQFPSGEHIHLHPSATIQHLNTPSISKRGAQREKPLLFCQILLFPSNFLPFFCPIFFFFFSFFFGRGVALLCTRLSHITSSHSTTGQSSTTTHRATVVKETPEVRDSTTRQTVPDCRGRTMEGEEL